MKVLVMERREPHYEHGRLVGHFIHRYYVDRPEAQEAASPARPVRSAAPPWQLECTSGSLQTFQRAVERQRALGLREGDSSAPPAPQQPRQPAPAAETRKARPRLRLECYAAVDTFRLAVERQKALGLR